MSTKQCLVCKETKPLESFKYGKHYLDSYGVTCLSCLERARAAREKPKKPVKTKKTKVVPQGIDLGWSPEDEARFLEKHKYVHTDWSSQALGTKEPDLYKCAGCKKEKDLFEFTTDNRRPFGISKYCKECAAIKRKAKRT